MAASEQLLVFDLDGTLIDSKADLISSVNATRGWMGLLPLGGELVSSYVGHGSAMLIKRALPDATNDELALAHQYFLDYYREHMLDETTLYPGVREGLNQLYAAAVPLAVLTNKPVRFSVTLLERLKLDRCFFRIYGGNSFEEKKPHPMGLEALMTERQVEASRTTMVGDSAVDILTARNAGARACGVSWGFQPETFVQSPPDFVISDLRELAQLVLDEI